MRYRFCGDKLQLVKYELTVTHHIDGGDADLTDKYTAANDVERDELLERYPDAVAAEIDNAGYEWLDGMTNEQYTEIIGKLN